MTKVKGKPPRDPQSLTRMQFDELLERGGRQEVTYSSVTSLGIPLGSVRSPLLLQRTTESTQVHWEGQGGDSRQLLSSLPAQGQRQAVRKPALQPKAPTPKVTGDKDQGGAA